MALATSGSLQQSALKQRSSILSAPLEVVEDLLLVDRPLSPAERKLIDLANAEAVRIVRDAVFEGRAQIVPTYVDIVMKRVAKKHGVSIHRMLTMKQFGDELAFEIAEAKDLSAESRRKLMAATSALDRRGLTCQPRERELLAERDRWIALVEVALAVIAIVVSTLTAWRGLPEAQTLAVASTICVAAIVLLRGVLIVRRLRQRNREWVRRSAELRETDEHSTDLVDLTETSLNEESDAAASDATSK